MTLRRGVFSASGLPACLLLLVGCRRSSVVGRVRWKESRGRGPRLPSPPATSGLQLLHVFLKLNFIKNKKVTGQSYVKFYDLQLLFGTSFDISCRSRDISEKPLSGVFFCKIRVNPVYLEAVFFTIVFRRCVLPKIQNVVIPSKSRFQTFVDWPIKLHSIVRCFYKKRVFSVF